MDSDESQIRVLYTIGYAHGSTFMDIVLVPAAGGANNSMERKSLPSVVTPLRSALCTKNAMNCIFRCQGSAHLAPDSHQDVENVGKLSNLQWYAWQDGKMCPVVREGTYVRSGRMLGKSG